MLALSGLLALAACQGGSTGGNDTVSGTDAQIVDSLILAAQASEGSGDWLAAAQYWGSLLQRDPGSERYAQGLGQALRQTGNYGDAVQVLRQGVEQNPESEPLLAELGKALLAAGQRDEAIGALNNAAIMNPNDWSVQSALGIANGMAGRPQVADQHYRQALALAPNNPVVLNNYALHLAINGRLDEGLAIMETAAASPGSTTQMRQNLALLLAVDGDMARAEQIVRGELPRESADRQMAFLKTLSSGDLINLGGIVDQSGLIIDSSQLAAPAGTGNVADLTNVGADDPGFLEDQPGVTVIDQEVLVAPTLSAPAAEQSLAGQQVANAEDELAPMIVAPAAEPVAEAPPQTLLEQSAALSASLADALDGAVPAAAQSVPAVEPPAPPPEDSLAAAVTSEVVAPVAVPVPAAEPEAVPPGPAWRVQLASLATRDAAERGRSKALADHAGLLGAQRVDVVAAVLDNGTTTWRVLAGRYAEKSGAIALCEALRVEGGECFVMKDNAGS